MNTTIAGLLPPANVAAELVNYLEKDCPALVARFARAMATPTSLEPDALGCTPIEWMQLHQAGFTEQAGEHFGANIALLLSGVKTVGELAYVGELSSVNIGRDRMSILHPSQIPIDQAECNQLFEAVSPLWEGTGISALPLNARQWRIWLPTPATLHSMTPAAVAQSSVTDWWPQDSSLRDWRKLLNEIQMVWYNHPINEHRISQGKPPINNIWLFGGAAPSALNPSRVKPPPHALIDTLADAHAAHDWAQWIAKLPALNTQITALPTEHTLNLLGHNKLITLTPIPVRWWHGLIKPRATHWKSWWKDQN